MEFVLVNTVTGDVIYRAVGRIKVRNFAIRKGFVKQERTKNFVHIVMGDYDIRPAT